MCVRRACGHGGIGGLTLYSALYGLGTIHGYSAKG
jgi:hypothetical protein